MRNLMSIVLMLSFVLALGVAGEDKKDVRKVEISGMHCDNCAAKVEKALMGVKGVKKVTVDHEKGEALVAIGAKASVKTADLVQAVASVGYTAKSGKIEIEPTEKCEDDCNDGEHKYHDVKKKESAETKAAGCCAVKPKT
ncbi:MAG: heavy-metal-associated domain-containing protein [Bacteroidota bacterium]